MVCGVVWLVGRRVFHLRSSNKLVFSKHALHELRPVIRRHGVAEADVAERLAGSAKREHWHDYLSGMSCTILGVALIEGMQADALLMQRNECEQEQQERRVCKCRLYTCACVTAVSSMNGRFLYAHAYARSMDCFQGFWHLITMEHPMVFFDLVDIQPFVEPLRYGTVAQTQRHVNSWNVLSTLTRDRCLAGRMVNGMTGAELLAYWGVCHQGMHLGIAACCNSIIRAR